MNPLKRPMLAMARRIRGEGPRPPPAPPPPPPVSCPSFYKVMAEPNLRARIFTAARPLRQRIAQNRRMRQRRNRLGIKPIPKDELRKAYLG